MKKILNLLLVLFVCLSLVACSGDNEEKSIENVDSNNSETQQVEEQQKEPTFDVPIILGDFEVTFYSQYSLDKVDNRYSDYYGKEVIRIPVKAKNIGSETQGINSFYLKCFGSKGTELDGISYYFDDSLETSGELRSGAEISCALYLLYDGDGDYYVEYDDWSNKVEIKLPISMNNVSSDVMDVDTSSSTTSAGEPGFNKVYNFESFEVTFSDNYSFTTVSNRYSDYNGKDVVRVPVHVKNIGDNTEGINMFYIKCFGSKGTELDGISYYFDDSLETSGELRPGAEISCALYLLYDGDGDYCVLFDDWSNNVEVILPITK